MHFSYTGGILIDRFNRYVYMALVSFFTGLFFMVIPFTTGLWSLCFVSVTAEFFMGLVDTGKTQYHAISYLHHSAGQPQCTYAYIML